MLMASCDAFYHGHRLIRHHEILGLCFFLVEPDTYEKKIESSSKSSCRCDMICSRAMCSLCLS